MLVLRYLFGAELSGGWLIVGMILTVAALGLVVMIKEFKDAILVSGVTEMHHPERRSPHPATTVNRDERGHLDQFYAEPRRSALGLNCKHAHMNRRRPPGNSLREIDKC